MQSRTVPDSEQLQRWLHDADVPFYLCNDCHGLHLSSLQEREGLIDARLFVEEQGVMFTAELEIRPSSLLMVHADLTRLNMLFPSLKLFLDINDDTLPRLVACDLLLCGQGISADQFVHFVQFCVQECGQLLDECAQTGCLLWPGEDDTPSSAPAGNALH